MTTLRRCSDSGLRRPPARNILALAFGLIALTAWAEDQGAGADTAARDKALAAASTRAAIQAFALGYVSEALALCDEALAFSPSMPDANFLRAAYGLSAGETPGSVMPRLEASLAGGAFDLRTRAEAKSLYASLLSRMRRSAEAMRMLQGLSPSAETLYVSSVCLTRLGDKAGARKAVVDSLKLFPSDPRALLAWLRSEDRETKNPADAEVISLGLSSLAALKNADPSVLTALAPYSGSVDEARTMVREFRAAGLSGSEATILALRYGYIKESKAIDEAFSGAYIPTRLDLWKLYSALSSDASRAEFSARFGAFSGSIATDDDLDGIAEAMTEYLGGLPSTWVSDSDQDGIPGTRIEFEDGAPKKAMIARGSSLVTLRFGKWPFLSEARFADADGSRLYLLAAGRLPLPLVSIAPLSGLFSQGPVLVAASSEMLPSEKAISIAAYSVERKSRASTETTLTSEGMPVLSAWKDGFGRSGFSVYEQGLPSPELIDQDGDGRMETRRVWRRTMDGMPAPAYVEIDLDSDGLYEYRETLSSPISKSWDYDADGAVDLTLTEGADGSRVYMVAGVRGLSDATTVVTRGGRIVEVAESGNALPVRADDGGHVTWIGTKPFDFGSTLPEPGYGSRKGRAYRVVEIDGALYARAFGD